MFLHCYGLRGGLCALLLLAASTLVAAHRRGKTDVVKPSKMGGESVEMFQAMRDGTIQVRFIAKNDKAATVLIANKTDKPLSVRLPQAFAGVPVLAQFGAMGMGGGGMGGGGMGGGGMGGGGSQGMGGGFGGGMGGGGMGGGGMGGGFFNVAPEQVGKVKVACLCLDHGKPDPSPRIPYEIRPIESYVDRPEVVELVKEFARGGMEHSAAQAAVWHLNNDLSWKNLAQKSSGKRVLFGGKLPYFSRQTLRQAIELAASARNRVAKNGAPPLSENTSLGRRRQP